MRKVIKGKLYDTDTARMIAHWSNGWGGSDYRSTTLYRKRTGEYFACEQVGEYDYSESITPMSYEDARDWAAQHTDGGDYESEFGTPDEGAEHDLHAIISETAWQALSRAATVEGVTVGAVIERLAATL